MKRRALGTVTTCLMIIAVLAPVPAGASKPLKWRALAPVPTPRTEAAAAVLDGEIYLMGGYASPMQTVPTVEIYNPEDNAWRSGPSLPLPVNHAAAVTLADEIYVLGGYFGYAMGSQFSAISVPTDRAFRLRGGAWQPISPMPAPRAAGGAAVVDGEIVLAGGVGLDGSNATSTFVYYPGSDTWREEAGLRLPRQHLGVVAVGKRAFAVGGRDDLLHSNTAAVETLNPSTMKWTTTRSMPTARGGLGAASTQNGFVVAVGGEGQNGTFAETEAFSPRTRRWISLPPLPTPRHGLGIAAIGNIVYALGGGPQPSYSYSDANEAIDLSALAH